MIFLWVGAGILGSTLTVSVELTVDLAIIALIVASWAWRLQTRHLVGLSVDLARDSGKRAVVSIFSAEGTVVVFLVIGLTEAVGAYLEAGWEEEIAIRECGVI